MRIDIYTHRDYIYVCVIYMCVPFVSVSVTSFKINDLQMVYGNSVTKS